MSMRFNINFKIAAPMIGITVFISLLLSVIAFQSMTINLEKNKIDHLQSNAKLSMDKLDRTMFDRISDIRLLSGNIVFDEESDINKLIEEFRRVEEEKKSYISMSIYNTKGIKLGDTRGIAIGLNESTKPFFMHAATGEIFFDKIPVMSQSLQVYVIHFSAPLRDETGGIKGVVVARFPISKINDIFASSEDVADLNIDLITKNGATIFSNHGINILEKTSENSIYDVISSGTKDVEFLKINEPYGEELYVAVKQKGFLDYKGSEWILVFGAPASAIFSSIDKVKQDFLIAAVVFVIIVIVFSLLIARTLSRPIVVLRDMVNEISKGNLDAKIKINSKDEVGNLAKTFNYMAYSLRKSKEVLESKVRERTRNLDRKVTELTEMKSALLNIMEDSDEANRELTEAHEKLQDSLKKLKEVDVKKDEFISIAAHELKTPLTSIHGFSQLLLNPSVMKVSGKRSKYLSIIESETKRLSNLVTEILDLSRIDLGTIKFIIEDVNTSEILNDIKKEMEIQILSKGLKPVYRIESNLPKIATDKERLVQILMNLINNSVKYTPKGSITVKAYREKEFIHFAVKDTGIGIPKEHHSKIFQRFYQVDSSYTRASGGTGLGLSLCKEFVASLGGKIWFTSAFGKGSEFHFILPIMSREVIKKYGQGNDTPERNAVTAKKPAENKTKKLYNRAKNPPDVQKMTEK